MNNYKVKKVNYKEEGVRGYKTRNLAILKGSDIWIIAKHSGISSHYIMHPSVKKNVVYVGNGLEITIDYKFLEHCLLSGCMPKACRTEVTYHP